MASLGCLILHGFAGDIHEVMPLARALRDLGCMVECPTLEGHGAGRQQLGRSNRHQWVRSAEEAYKRLAMRAEQIVVIGFSMGGLLAFHVASRYPVSLLFTLNTPYHYWDLRQVAENLRENPRAHLQRYIRGLTKIPLHSMIQFRKLLSETKQLLPSITCPYVILQGKRDDTVQSISAEYLAKSVGSSAVQIHYFARSGHLLLLQEEAQQAIQQIINTLTEHRLLAN